MENSYKNRMSSLFNIQAGLPYSRLLKYFYPECISALILYFLPYCINCLFISSLKSTSTYAVSGLMDNFLTIYLKIAEGLPVALVIIAGYYNGLAEYRKSGQAFTDVFWTTVSVGSVLAIGLYFLIPWICVFHKFSPEMVAQATPFLQIKSLAVLFMFIYFALIGFLRAIKNTFVPMVAYAIGSALFIGLDYVLIFGKFGFAPMGLIGSAIAGLVQYLFMCCLVLGYLFYSTKTAKYHLSLLFENFDVSRIKTIILTSLPIMIDKASIAFGYIWLASCISKLGPEAGAAFSCVKTMERFSFVPAIAFAQVVTFVISNDVGLGKWDDIYANIKKISLMAMVIVGTLLLIGSLWPAWFASFLDKQGDFGHLVAVIFPGLSVLILVDLLQLILSGALRGMGDVNTVMITRVTVIAGFFIPMSYAVEYISFSSMAYKILFTYATFLFGNVLMSLVYIYRLRTKKLPTKAKDLQ